MYNEQSLLKEIEAMGIKYEYHAHDPVFTVDQANAMQIDIKGAHCKNLFVKNKNGDKWILVIPDHERADLKSISEKLNSGRFSFCSADEMMGHLGVTPGSVTPLAIVNNSQKDVTLVIDKGLADSAVINCHPLVNTATISVRFKDLAKIVKHFGHDMIITDLCRA